MVEELDDVDDKVMSEDIKDDDIKVGENDRIVVVLEEMLDLEHEVNDDTYDLEDHNVKGDFEGITYVYVM